MNIPRIIGAAAFGLVMLIIFWAYDHYFVPLSSRRWVKKILRKIQSGETIAPAKPRRSDYGITFDSIGFTLTQYKRHSNCTVTMRWDEIQTVTAFKRDHLIVDCVCLFLARCDDFGIELNEEMNGWKEFGEAMPKYLTGCRKWEEWFLDVAFLAFATNVTRIYSREVEVCA